MEAAFGWNPNPGAGPPSGSHCPNKDHHERRTTASASEILMMVEGSPPDGMMAQEALQYAKLLNNVHVVEDGVEAMTFLRLEGSYASVPRPDLILLDLNLPRKDGREVLADIKADPSLMSIPVLVLTISQAEEDIVRGYQLHGNCYITKPVDFQRFADVVRANQFFWFSVVSLPGRDS